MDPQRIDRAMVLLREARLILRDAEDAVPPELLLPDRTPARKRFEQLADLLHVYTGHLRKIADESAIAAGAR